MAESAAVRNARALGQLREMGLAPGPLKGAYHRLRVARGVARGLSASQAMGKPRLGEASATGIVRQTTTAMRRGSRPKRDVEFRHGLGRIVQSVDRSYVRGELKRAAGRGERVSVRVTANDGRGVRTRAIEGTPEQQQFIAGRVSQPAGGEPDRPDIELVGKPQFTFSDSPHIFDQGSGFDPLDLLAFLDDYDDWLDALGDLYAETYFDS